MGGGERANGKRFRKSSSLTIAAGATAQSRVSWMLPNKEGSEIYNGATFFLFFSRPLLSFAVRMISPGEIIVIKNGRLGECVRAFHTSLHSCSGGNGKMNNLGLYLLFFFSFVWISLDSYISHTNMAELIRTSHSQDSPLLFVSFLKKSFERIQHIITRHVILKGEHALPNNWQR